MIWVDGEPAQALPLPDRGLDFGDGLFETLLVRQGVPLFLPLHMERLAAGVDLLSFPDCIDAAKAQLSHSAARLSDLDWAACASRSRAVVLPGATQRLLKRCHV
ncbi:hypothetical protein GPB2148_572 [marine gamma proteobacterium HTCC2148]|nr:hypothetical protein GPB2148_572 [marine gamma proteobacterium HTCC2148]